MKKVYSSGDKGFLVPNNFRPEMFCSDGHDRLDLTHGRKDRFFGPAGL